jgi:omega-6 fatty acid desaturase (delta-12 desaturase)
MASPIESAAPEEVETGPTITDVIDKLPEHVYENPTALGLLYFARDVALYAGLVALLFAFDSPFLLVPLWLLTALSISALFIIGHDAAHGALFSSKRMNYVIGQAAMLPSLHVFEAWVFGHNRIHHGHTVREVMDYVWHPATPESYRAMTPVQRGLHRVKWSWLGAGVYYGWDIWWKNMMRFDAPAKIAADVKRDRAIVWAYAAVVNVALLAAGAGLYGSVGGALWLWFKVFAVPFVLWNYVIGIAVYVHHISPDIAWQNRREWTRFKGQMEGTTILHVPGWVNFFMHNIMLHVPHHVDMRIPFYRLPEACDAIRRDFGEIVREKSFHFADYLRTTRACKLYDFTNHTWRGYDAAKEAPELVAQA